MTESHDHTVIAGADASAPTARPRPQLIPIDRLAGEMVLIRESRSSWLNRRNTLAGVVLARIGGAAPRLLSAQRCY